MRDQCIEIEHDDRGVVDRRYASVITPPRSLGVVRSSISSSAHVDHLVDHDADQAIAVANEQDADRPRPARGRVERARRDR